MAMATDTIPFDAGPVFRRQVAAAASRRCARYGECGYIAAAIGTVARARGMSKVARAQVFRAAPFTRRLAPRATRSYRRCSRS